MNEAGPVPRRHRLTRAEAKEQTRQRLLESAARAFAEKGFGGASLEEIAESAGYSTGALYANFANKDELFMEVVATRRARTAVRRAEAVAEAVAEVVAEVVDQEADPFGALSRLFVQAADRDREFAPLQAEFWLYAVRHPAAMGVIAAAVSDQVDALEPVVARALDHFGAAADAAPREVTMVMMALFTGLARQRRLDPHAVPDDLFGRALRWLIVGVRAEDVP
jgi:AcrR family transcriptional regulator